MNIDALLLRLVTGRPIPVGLDGRQLVAGLRGAGTRREEEEEREGSPNLGPGRPLHWGGRAA